MHCGNKSVSPCFAFAQIDWLWNLLFASLSPPDEHIGQALEEWRIHSKSSHRAKHIVSKKPSLGRFFCTLCLFIHSLVEATCGLFTIFRWSGLATWVAHTQYWNWPFFLRQPTNHAHLCTSLLCLRTFTLHPQPGLFFAVHRKMVPQHNSLLRLLTSPLWSHLPVHGFWPQRVKTLVQFFVNKPP